MKFLIVIPRYTSKVGGCYELPLGLAYVSASLKKHGYEVDVLNLNGEPGPIDKLIRRHADRGRPDVVATGGLSVDYCRVRAIVEAARRHSPWSLVVVGGGLISSEPAVATRALGADVGVMGEGEETIVELAAAVRDGRDYSGIQGIVYDEGRAVTAMRPYIADLSSVPMPDYEGIGLRQYLGYQRPSDSYARSFVDHPRAVSVISSRSCPYNCTFCYHPLGKKYRQRPLGDVFAEIAHLVSEYQVNIVFPYDELFATDRERVAEFCDGIREFNIRWAVALRVDSVTRDLLRMMKDAGLAWISYGIESASDAVLGSMKKKTTVAQINRALELTREAGIGYQGNMIFGDVAETRETARETLEWLHRNPQHMVSASFIQVYPGSELYKHALERGLIPDKVKYIESLENPPCLNLTHMTDREFEDISAAAAEYRYTYLNRKADLVSVEHRGVDSWGRETYAITVRCFHCGHLNHLDNMAAPEQTGNSFSFCRNCYNRYNIELYYFYDYERLNRRIDALLGQIRPGLRVALWGAAERTWFLLYMTRLAEANPTCIFVWNEANYARSIRRIKVVQYPDDPAKVKDTADVLILCSGSQDDDVATYAQICDLELWGVKVLRVSPASKAQQLVVGLGRALAWVRQGFGLPMRLEPGAQSRIQRWAGRLIRSAYVRGVLATL